MHVFSGAEITRFLNLLMARDFWSKRLMPRRLDTLCQPEFGGGLV
jgi:hypothetical protein